MIKNLIECVMLGGDANKIVEKIGLQESLIAVPASDKKAAEKFFNVNNIYYDVGVSTKHSGYTLFDIDNININDVLSDLRKKGIRAVKE